MGKAVDWAALCCMGVALVSQCTIDTFELCCPKGFYEVASGSGAADYTTVDRGQTRKATHVCNGDAVDDARECVAVCAAFMNGTV